MKLNIFLCARGTWGELFPWHYFCRAATNTGHLNDIIVYDVRSVCMYILPNHGQTALVFLRQIPSTPRSRHQLRASRQSPLWLSEKSKAAIRCVARTRALRSPMGEGLATQKMTTWRQSKRSLHFPGVDVSFGKYVFWNPASPTPAIQRAGGSFQEKHWRLQLRFIVLPVTSVCS